MHAKECRISARMRNGTACHVIFASFHSFGSFMHFSWCADDHFSDEACIVYAITLRLDAYVISYILAFEADGVSHAHYVHTYIFIVIVSSKPGYYVILFVCYRDERAGVQEIENQSEIRHFQMQLTHKM